MPEPWKGETFLETIRLSWRSGSSMNPEVSVALARAFSPLLSPRLTPWAIILPPRAGLCNTLDRFLDTFSASGGMARSIRIN
jgi:hypothetical protein